MLLRFTITLVLMTFLTGCSFLTPNPPLMQLSPCYEPLACPPPYPCAPVEVPKPCKNLTLAELVDLGLENNPQTREAWANARSASANLGIANSAFFPQIAITWTAEREQNAQPQLLPQPAFTTYSPQLTASYLLWDFGGRIDAMNNARETLLAAGWNYSWTVQTVMFTVIQSYYNYLDSVAQLEAYRESLVDAQTVLEAAEVSFQAGINTIVDVYQAKANVSQAELNVIQEYGTMETNLATLATAIGLPPETCLKIAKPQERPTRIVCCDVERMVEGARCCRADLEGLRAGIRAQRATVLQQISGLYPTITGSFTGGRTYFHKHGHDRQDFSESVVLNIPIFSGFSQVNAIRQAEAEVDSLLAAYKNSELQALLAVLSNYYAVKTAIESFEASKEQVFYAQKAYEGVLVGYKSGINTIVDLMNAENTLSTARSNLVQAEFNWFTSIANLAYTRGVLISNEPLNTPKNHCKVKEET